MESKKKKVLVAPLNWGLGHATRCIPVIKEFLKQGAVVLIGADGRPLDLLKEEFPLLSFIKLPGYSIEYSEKSSMAFKMFLSSPGIFGAIKQEHEMLEKIVDEQNIDIVVSDNRYGCWSKKAFSVFMTHQVYIKCPGHLKWFEPLLFKINKRFISKYNECWVPDFAGEENLSGSLSHGEKIRNIKFVGLLSRFHSSDKEINHFEKYDVLIICSGPEPQRSVFEKLVSREILKTNLKAVLVKGVTETGKRNEQKGNLQIISYADTNEMQDIIESSSIIISRPGYSTIMDLVTLGKKAIFIPTPGQTEQEYLAEYFMKKNIFYSVPQKKFHLQIELQKIKDYSGLKIPSQPELLYGAISSII